MQAAILANDGSTIMPWVHDGARADRATLFGVYGSAYSGRLAGILKADFPHLAAYVGGTNFDAAARRYIAAHPSHHRSARWFGQDFADHIKTDPGLADHPQCSELAALEWALGIAFDAPDAAALTVTDLARCPPSDWAALVFTPHPAAARFTQTFNAVEIWMAFKEGHAPPAASRLIEPTTYLIWRRDGIPAIRLLATEEAMLWESADRGHSFGRLCELAAHFDDPATAAERVAGYVGCWLDAGVLTAASVPVAVQT